MADRISCELMKTLMAGDRLLGFLMSEEGKAHEKAERAALDRSDSR